MIKRWRPRLVKATLGQFFTAMSQASNTQSDEKLVVVTMGPFMFVGPGEKRAWK
ncbi:hypothetical protein SEA_BAZZLE_124 [Mycobacterium phage Bazzle]